MEQEKENKISVQSIEMFKKYLFEEERSAATIEKYVRDIKGFYTFLDETKCITREKVLDYKIKIRQEYKVTSVNSMLAALNQFLQFSGLSHYKVKRIKVQNSGFREEEKELSEKEYKDLVKQAYETGEKRLALIMETIGSTGIRISELKYFTVSAVRQGKIQISNKGKVRMILIPDRLKKKLLYYANKAEIGKGKIFITASGKPVNRSNVWREMKKMGIKAKVLEKKIYPHNLRYLFASVYYQKYKDIIGLADILGHTCVETTRIYTTTSAKEYKKRLDHLSLLT